MMTREELQQVREDARRQIEAYDCRILVCSGTGCIATGSTKIYEEFLELVKNTPGIVLDFAPHDEDGEHVGVKKTGCQGFCELGPLVRIQRGDEVIQYVKVQPEDCREIFEETVVRGEIVDHLLYTKKDVHYKHPEDIPFMAKQTRIVLENCGRVDAESLDEYIASGGFEALNKAMFEMSRDEVIDEVDRSGLRGRGGGGFPCGRKWKQVARQKETVRYVVCNGDEGDPGAFMDGSVMEGDPFKLIEGVHYAGKRHTQGQHACRGCQGVIYRKQAWNLQIDAAGDAVAQQVEPDAVHRIRDILRRVMGHGIVCRIGYLTAGKSFDHPHPIGVVQIVHADVRLDKQLLFGCQVVFHRQVIVQMILSQIGEDPGFKSESCNPPLIQGVGGYLHHAKLAFLLHHGGQCPVKFFGIGGRIVGLKDPPSRPAAQCPDDAADVSRPLQHGLDHVGDGGFAVGAGDADETQFFRWESIECSAQRRISLTGIRHDQLIF